MNRKNDENTLSEQEASASRQAERALKRAEQEKRAILDSLVEHVVYQDTEMNVLGLTKRRGNRWIGHERIW